MSTFNNEMQINKLVILNNESDNNYSAVVENENLYIKYGDNTAIEIDPINRTLTGQIIDIKQQSSDPQKPAEGNSIMWLSDGTGLGNAGDLMIASTINGETKYNRLFNYEESYPWF